MTHLATGSIQYFHFCFFCFAVKCLMIEKICVYSFIHVMHKKKEEKRYLLIRKVYKEKIQPKSTKKNP